MPETPQQPPTQPQRWTLWRWPESAYAHHRGWQVATEGEDIPSAAETVEVGPAPKADTLALLTSLAEEWEKRVAKFLNCEAGSYEGGLLDAARIAADDFRAVLDQLNQEGTD